MKGVNQRKKTVSKLYPRFCSYLPRSDQDQKALLISISNNSDSWRPQKEENGQRLWHCPNSEAFDKEWLNKEEMREEMQWYFVGDKFRARIRINAPFDMCVVKDETDGVVCQIFKHQHTKLALGVGYKDFIPKELIRSPWIVIERYDLSWKYAFQAIQRIQVTVAGVRFADQEKFPIREKGNNPYWWVGQSQGDYHQDSILFYQYMFEDEEWLKQQSRKLRQQSARYYRYLTCARKNLKRKIKKKSKECLVGQTA